ncbi:hypothetical protein BDK51DRAFT_25732, partial [Blyttiomyces helicus]
MGRKDTTRKVLTDLPVPVPAERQYLAKVLEPRGGGLHEVNVRGDEAPEDPVLVSLPSKFRKLIWVKRGSFVIVQLTPSTTKIAGEILHVLFPEHIKHIKSISMWPPEFDAPTPPPGRSETACGDGEEYSVTAVTGIPNGEEIEESEEEDNDDDL